MPLIIFVAAVFVLVVALAGYIFIVLPEMVEYNDHLAAIEEAVEAGNCSAAMITVYPDYYPVADHEQEHRIEVS